MVASTSQNYHQSAKTILISCLQRQLSVVCPHADYSAVELYNYFNFELNGEAEIALGLVALRPCSFMR